MNSQSKTVKAPISDKESKIADLKAQLVALEGDAKNVKPDSAMEEPEEEIVIRPDEFINVMSLLPWKLNLATLERGQGKIYRFSSFGQIKRILYSDLINIFEVHEAFLNAGNFFIMSPKVIKKHGLEELYKTILTKAKIEQILDGQDVETCVALYASANESQQKVIVSCMVDKLVENPDSLNLNLVDKISRLSKINIAEKARDTAESFSREETKEEK